MTFLCFVVNQHMKVKTESHSFVSESLQPHGL